MPDIPFMSCPAGIAIPGIEDMSALPPCPCRWCAAAEPTVFLFSDDRTGVFVRLAEAELLDTGFLPEGFFAAGIFMPGIFIPGIFMFI